MGDFFLAGCLRSPRLVMDWGLGGTNVLSADFSTLKEDGLTKVGLVFFPVWADADELLARFIGLFGGNSLAAAEPLFVRATETFFCAVGVAGAPLLTGDVFDFLAVFELETLSVSFAFDLILFCTLDFLAGDFGSSSTLLAVDVMPLFAEDELSEGVILFSRSVRSA